jgi:hypothetical protein
VYVERKRKRSYGDRVVSLTVSDRSATVYTVSTVVKGRRKDNDTPANNKRLLVVEVDRESRNEVDWVESVFIGTRHR